MMRAQNGGGIVWQSTLCILLLLWQFRFSTCDISIDLPMATACMTDWPEDSCARPLHLVLTSTTAEQMNAVDACSMCVAYCHEHVSNQIAWARPHVACKLCLLSSAQCRIGISLIGKPAGAYAFKLPAEEEAIADLVNSTVILSKLSVPSQI